MHSSRVVTEKEKLRVLFSAIADKFKIPSALVNVTIGQSVERMTEEDAADTNDVIRKWAVWSRKNTPAKVSQS